jgi:hypothetical protein
MNEENKEIFELELLKKECELTNCEKFAANKLLSKIKIFNHTFNNNFNLAKKFYTLNSSAEIDISDGIEDLETYAKSKLKVKDDKYFYRGLNKLRDGLQTLIFNLKST